MNVQTRFGLTLLVALFTATSRAQVNYLEDATDLVNDYQSIGAFNTDGDVEGWNRNTASIAPLKVANGVVQVTTTGGDPFFYRAGITNLPPEFTTAEVRIRILAGSGNGWELFWGTSGDGQGGFSGGRRIGYTVGFTDNEFHIIQFDMTEALAGASLTDFRIDPGQDAGNKFEIDYVRIGKISPDADADGLPDAVETGTGVFVDARDTGTKPNNADSDGDGTSDGIEVQSGTDPNNPAVFPVPAIDRFTVNPADYVIGIEIAANAPTVSNGTATSFAIAPVLPAGLKFDTANGNITGTPTAASAATDYTVTANFSGGKTATKILSLTVHNPYFDFTVTQQTYKVNSAIAEFLPNTYGPAPTSFSVSPSLPEGLALDTTSGAISGTPTQFTTPTTYVVTAKYNGTPDATAELILAALEDPGVTLDPVKLITDYFSLGEFTDAADATGWFQNSIQQPFQIADGAMTIETIGGDPYFGRGSLTLSSVSKILEFRLQATSGPFAIRIYWSEDAPGRGFSEATAFTLPSVPDDQAFHVFQVDFSKATVGSFNAIRLDPGDGAGTIFQLDYLRVGSFLPRLQISSQTDGSVKVSWPAAATADGFALQSAPAVPGVWTADNSTVQTEGDQKYILTQPSASARYFRLTQ